MQKQLRSLILRLLDDCRIMTLATVRPDGYPQATTVGFAHDDLNLYFACGAKSQKAENIAADDKVSLAIDEDSDDLLAIKGLSLGGRAAQVTDPEEAAFTMTALMKRYPSMDDVPEMDEDDVAVFRVTPEVVSVLDYSKGFGHTDLVRIERGDVHSPHTSEKHRWKFWARK